MEMMERANQRLKQFNQIVTSHQKIQSNTTQFRAGVDLGTSSIVLSVLDQAGKLVFGAYEYDNAVQDGIVVNFMESVNILRRLKQKAEEQIGQELITATGAIPPNTGQKSTKVVANVIEEAGFICTGVVDEPTAAAKFLQMKTGTVVDIGGGTTGITIFKNGQIKKVIDEATGGFHMTLVLGGSYRISNDEAEKLKRDKTREQEVFLTVKPVVEKMAAIVKKLEPLVEDPVIVVGGATNFKDFVTVFEKELHRPVYKPLYPQFVTPLGIAMFDPVKA